MSAENLSIVILGILGVSLQLVFRYVPKAQEWLTAQSHRGLLMLVGVVVVGAAYFGLACTPYAVELGISLACDKASLFTLLRALFIMASSNQLTYLFTRGQ